MSPNHNYRSGDKRAKIPAVCRQCQEPFKRRAERPSAFCSHSCAAIYNRFRINGGRKISFASCHPDRKLAGKGLCKLCYYKKYWKEHPEKLEIQRGRSLQRRLFDEYGLTPKDLVRMHEEQKGVCPICDSPLPPPILRQRGKGGSVYLAVDHDAKSGKVRGLLHGRCNSHLVGSNTIESAKKVLAYLEGRQ